VNQTDIPLTPAEEMRRVREFIRAMDPSADLDAYALLQAYFSRLDTLRQHIVELESEMIIQEQPFQSRAPLIGPLIVWLRTAWNWMSTKWYVSPLVQQQNELNMALIQMLRELVVSTETVASAMKDLQARVAELDTASAREHFARD